MDDRLGSDWQADLAAPACLNETFGSTPGLRCGVTDPAGSRRIAALIAHVRDRYGLDADHLGLEELWEWAGGREEREGGIAHLLLSWRPPSPLGRFATRRVDRLLQTVTPEQPR